jgi:hypothetical protein
MPNWKKALILGSFTASALFLLKGNKTLGFAMAGVAGATLASQYPEQCRRLWERAPEYLERGSQLMASIERIRERFEQEAPGTGPVLWRDAETY